MSAKKKKKKKCPEWDLNSHQTNFYTHKDYWTIGFLLCAKNDITLLIIWKFFYLRV